MTGSPPIAVLIVDDEAPARAKLRQALAAEAGFEVIGEATDGREAVDSICDLRPDLVFLDVQMPKLDGFGVLAEVGIGRVPWLVFVTAYDEFALRAFESQALDYLLKPWSPPRLRKVLERIRAEKADRQGSDVDSRLDLLLQSLDRPAASAPARLTRLLVEKGEEREILLAVGKIDWVRADGNTLRFFTRDGVFARRMTLTELETRLDPEQFLRINRSELVRLDAVAEVQPLFHGESRVVLSDGRQLSWSRRYRARSVDRF